MAKSSQQLSFLQQLKKIYTSKIAVHIRYFLVALLLLVGVLGLTLQSSNLIDFILSIVAILVAILITPNRLLIFLLAVLYFLVSLTKNLSMSTAVIISAIIIAAAILLGFYRDYIFDEDNEE